MKCNNCGKDLDNTSSSEVYALCSECIKLETETWLDNKLKEHGDE